MFRVKLQTDPQVVSKYHRYVKTGVRGLGFVRNNPKIPWPPELGPEAAGMSEAIVARVERVTHRYGKTFALNDVTLDIPAQCRAGLIGPDGVGKSTLLALIAGVRKIKPAKSWCSTATWPRSIAGQVTADRLHAAGPWPQSLSDAERLRQHRLLRPLVRAGRGRAARAHRRASESHRARSVSRIGRAASFRVA